MTVSFYKINKVKYGNIIHLYVKMKLKFAYNPVDELNLSRALRPAYTQSEIKNKVIFVHIAKNAGSSFVTSLFGIKDSSHATLYKYYLDNPEFYRNFYKISVIRNPWDRFVSAGHPQKPTAFAAGMIHFPELIGRDGGAAGGLVRAFGPS